MEAPRRDNARFKASLLRGLGDAERFGLEVVMTIDSCRSGARVLEVPVQMDHHHTGRSVSGLPPPRVPGVGRCEGRMAAHDWSSH